MNKLKKLTELTREELNEISDLFVDQTHSEGWKIAEAKDLMSEDYKCFIEKPKENWKENITEYLTKNGYELPKNRLFI